jgi:hypothetical protein
MTISFDELFAIRIQLQDYNIDENDIIRRLKFALINSGLSLINTNQYLVEFYSNFGIDINLEIIQQVEINNLFQFNNLFNFINNSNLSNIPESDQENNDQENNDQENNDQENEIDEEENNETLLNNLPSPPTHSPQHPSSVYNFNIPLNNLQNLENMISNDNLLPQEFNFFTNIISNILNQTPEPEQTVDNEDILVTLNDNTLNNLPEEIVTTDDYDRCTICLMDIDKGDNIIKLKCAHYFHKDCIIEYLKDFDYKCPICRYEIGDTKAHIN